ncbi:MAG: hypothetical protein WAO02_07120 [Verrucomicrobiia bacterium]
MFVETSATEPTEFVSAKAVVVARAIARSAAENFHFRFICWNVLPLDEKLQNFLHEIPSIN